MLPFDQNQLSLLKNQLKNNKFKEEVFKKRYKNFFTLPIFIILMVGFLYMGFAYRERFFSTFIWYIYIGLVSIFLILGVYTWLSYGWLIIKSWRSRGGK